MEKLRKAGNYLVDCEVEEELTVRLKDTQHRRILLVPSVSILQFSVSLWSISVSTKRV